MKIHESQDTLVSRVKADLIDSGFGSEMKAIKAFWEKGWESYGSQSFFDLDEEKSREYDVLASQRMLNDSGDGSHCVVFYDIVAEVKKTDKPWVVFRHNPNSEDDLEVGWSDVIHTQLNLPCDGPDLYNTFQETSLMQLNKWKGYGIHESFKKPDRQSQWYSAFVTAHKAAVHQLTINDVSEEVDEAQEYDALRSSRLHIVKPIVILDGLLFSAELTDVDDVWVEPISNASVSFNFETANYDDDRLKTSNIDVVTLANVQEFAALCVHRQSLLLERLVELALERRTVEK